MNTRHLLSAILLFLTFQVFGQGPYYVQKIDHAQLNGFYDERLEAAAFELSQSINPTVGDTFKILSYNLMPILAYAGEPSFNESLEYVANDLAAQENYLAIIKKIILDDSGNPNVAFQVNFDLPSSSDTLTQLEKEAIQSKIQRLTFDLFEVSRNSIKAELEIINIFSSHLDGMEITEALEESGYQKLDISNIDITAEEGASFRNKSVSRNEFIIENTLYRIRNINESVYVNLIDLLPGNSVTIDITTFSVNYYLQSNIHPIEFDIEHHLSSEGDFGISFYSIISETSAVESLYFKAIINDADNISELLVDYAVTNSLASSGASIESLSRENIVSTRSAIINPTWGFNQIESNPNLPFMTGIIYGILDGFLGSIQAIWDLGKGVVKVVDASASYFGELVSEGIKEQSLFAVFAKFGNDVINVGKKIVEGCKMFYTIVSQIASNINEIIACFKEVIFDFFGDVIDGDAFAGHTLGLIMFEVVFIVISSVATLGASGAKYIAQFMKLFKSSKFGVSDLANGLGMALNNALNGASKIGKASSKLFKCNILGKGCFIKDTPVLMANNPFRNVVPAVALAGMPLVAPIQNIQVDDMVKAYHHKEMYLRASNDNDIYVPGWQDYDYLDITPETWQVGKFIITEEDGSLVEVEANRPKEWFEDQGVTDVGSSTFLILEEIGVFGNAKLLELKVTDIDTRTFKLNESGIVVRPVITTFKRIAQEISDYTFSNGQVISCTPNHPFYSSDRQVYLPIGELTSGEKVQTAGEREVTFIGGKAREKGEHVYNFEVWREHNYYVGFEGREDFVLAHNICWKEIDDFFKMSLTDKRKIISDAYDAWYPQIFARRSFLEGIMRKTKFKDWNHTFDLAKNFKGIDFYRKVNGKNIVSSMKTTKVDNVQSWITQNTQHLTDLVNGKIAKNFSWNGNNIPADIVQLNLFTKKGLSAAERISWKNAIEAHTNGKIQVIVEVIEESL